MDDQGNIARNTIVLILITIIGKFMGLFREVLFGAQFGATSTMDAFLVAMTIPNVIFTSIVSMTIVTIFVPVFYKAKVEGGESRSLAFTNNILMVTSIFYFILTVAGSRFSKEIVFLLASGFPKEVAQLASSLTKISFMMIAFINISSTLSAFLQSKNNFSVPALAALPNNIVVIATLGISDRIGVQGVISGCLAGSILQAIMVLFFSMKKGYRFMPILSVRDKYLRYAGSLALPVLISIGIQEINTMVDRVLASGLMEGSISALNYSSKINGFVFAVFSLSISTVIFPALSRLGAEKNKQEFRNTLTTSINMVTILLIPVTIGVVILRNPITMLLFERGAFTREATLMTSSALLFYGSGIVFFGYRNILNRAFYALHDTKTPMVNGIIAITGNIILNLILVGPMKHNGLALATTLSGVATTVLLFCSLRGVISAKETRKMLAVFAKCSLAGGCMGAFVLAIFHFIGNDFFYESRIKTASMLIFSISSGAIIYFVLLYLLGIKELRAIHSKFNAKLVSKRMVG